MAYQDSGFEERGEHEPSVSRSLQARPFLLSALSFLPSHRLGLSRSAHTGEWRLAGRRSPFGMIRS